MNTPPPNSPHETAAAEWLERNRGVIAASNAWVEEYGLPLRSHRLF
jgi:post-segregation antitoxin (ccd killing protein)